MAQHSSDSREARIKDIMRYIENRLHTMTPPVTEVDDSDSALEDRPRFIGSLDLVTTFDTKIRESRDAGADHIMPVRPPTVKYTTSAWQATILSSDFIANSSRVFRDPVGSSAIASIAEEVLVGIAVSVTMAMRVAMGKTTKNLN